MGIAWTPAMIARELITLQRDSSEGAIYFKSPDDLKEFTSNFKIHKLCSFAAHDPEVIDEVRNRTAYTASMLVVLDPENKKFDIYRVSSSGGCFIATAVYGSPLAPEVILWRRFRDEVLLTSKFGAVIVRAYYWASPPFAGFISKTRLVRVGINLFVLQPASRLRNHILRL